MKKHLLTSATIATAVVAAAVIAVISPLSHGENLPLTAEQQKALTPDEVLERMMEGNKRYMANELTNVDITANIQAAAEGQFPKAVVLSCLDSRVPVEKVFDQSNGDLFVGRVAGNIENEDQLGSMEFAAKLVGVKLVMVLGHEACGAVKGACDGAEMGNLTALLAKIKPAVDAVEGFEADQRNSKNAEFVDQVVHANIKKTVADIRERSTILKELENSGKIKIVGAYYSLKDGSVTLVD